MGLAQNAVLLTFFLTGAMACSAPADDVGDEAQAVTEGEDTSGFKQLAQETKTIELTYGGSKRVLAAADPNFARAMGAIDFKQAPKSSDQASIGFCPNGNVDLKDAAGAKLAFFSLCGKQSLQITRVKPTRAQQAIDVDIDVIQGLAQLGDIKTRTDRVQLTAGGASRTITKADAEFAEVVGALALEQAPIVGEEIPAVAFCPSTNGVRLFASGTLLASLDIPCGDSAADRNGVEVVYPSESPARVRVGLSINGKKLEALAKR